MQKKVSGLVITKLVFNKSRNPVEISFKFLRYFHFHLWIFHCNKMGPQATFVSPEAVCVEWRSLHTGVRKTSGRTSQRDGTQIVLARCKIVGTY